MLSHLEISRALERAVRRSGLPFAVTNGFSPHMRIAFGAALPVGVGGEEEIFDIFLLSYVAPGKALAALQEASADDLAPVSCSYVENSAPAASVALPFSTYSAVFDGDVRELVVPETITVKRKKKEKVLAVADFLVGDVAVCGDTVQFTLEAKESGSMRADVFLQECIDATFVADDGSVESAPRMISMTRVSQGNQAGA